MRNRHLLNSECFQNKDEMMRQEVQKQTARTKVGLFLSRLGRAVAKKEFATGSNGGLLDYLSGSSP